MTSIVLVTPVTTRIDWMRGYPAIHMVNPNKPEVTLCGKPCDGWRDNPDLTAQDITCKVCRGALIGINLDLVLSLEARAAALDGVHYPGSGFHHELRPDLANTRTLFLEAKQNPADWETLMIAMIRIESIERRILAAERSRHE